MFCIPRSRLSMFVSCYNHTSLKSAPTKFVWLKHQSCDNLFFNVIVFPISCSCKISIKLKNLFKTNKKISKVCIRFQEGSLHSCWQLSRCQSLGTVTLQLVRSQSLTWHALAFTVICPNAGSGGRPDNSSMIFYNNNTEVQLFEKWWDKSRTVPFYLIGLLLPLLNFKSPSFFSKFNILGKILLCGTSCQWGDSHLLLF